MHELRTAEAEVWRLGGADEVLASNKKLLRKAELLTSMLIECEKHVEALEGDKRAQARAVVDDMVELGRAAHLDLWRSAETRPGGSSDAQIRPMVAHERKIAARGKRFFSLNVSLSLSHVKYKK